MKVRIQVRQLPCPPFRGIFFVPARQVLTDLHEPAWIMVVKSGPLCTGHHVPGYLPSADVRLFPSACSVEDQGGEAPERLADMAKEVIYRTTRQHS